MNTKQYDLAIIGAGPAGMSAATTAAHQGLSVVLLDEQATAGGQIYRSISQPGPADERILGPDYYRGRSLLSALQGAAVDYLPGTTVWAVDSDLTLSVSRDGRSHRIRASRLLIATGAQLPAPNYWRNV